MNKHLRTVQILRLVTWKERKVEEKKECCVLQDVYFVLLQKVKIWMIRRIQRTVRHLRDLLTKTAGRVKPDADSNNKKSKAMHSTLDDIIQQVNN